MQRLHDFNKGDRVRLTELALKGKRNPINKIGTVSRKPRGKIICVDWDGGPSDDYYTYSLLERAMEEQAHV